MLRVIALTTLVLAVCEARVDSNQFLDKVSKNSARQKRLLFFDEEGNLVKTYKNPYLNDFSQNAEKSQLPANIFNPFFSFLRPTFGGPTAYMIPVSDEVIQQINNDPMYQNKLLTLPRKDLLVEPNPLCAGKRSQIPAKTCKNFLNCWDGWAFEQECPEGLLFSVEGYCDYPRNVDCSQRTHEPMPMKAQCNKEFESFRNEQQCSEFFVCVDRVPIRFKCPADLAYNQELGICDYPDRVDCNATTASTLNEPAIQSKPSTMCSSPPSSDASKTPSASPPAPASGESSPPDDIKTVLMSDSVVNSQSWMSSHMAISRQDAIRQLQLRATPSINAA